MSLRVAQIIESDGPGGAESVVLVLCRALRALGIEVVPFVLEGGEGWLSGQLQKEGFEVQRHTIDHTKRFDGHFLRRLRRAFSAMQIDVVHSHEFTMSVYGSMACAFSRRLHVVTMHGGQFYEGAWHRRISLRRTIRAAHAAVGVSSATCRRLEQSLRLPPESVTCVANGIAPVAGSRGIGRKRLGLADDTKLILAVGNLYEVKGHRVLLDAARLLIDMSDLPGWRIAIAGRGDQLSALEKQRALLGLSERVDFLGLRSDIPDLLAAADAWVMPSLSEGLPMALLEAMHAELPVVCSAVGGIPSVLENGRAGVLVEPNNPATLAAALAFTLRSETSARTLALAAKQVATAQFSDTAMAKAYLELYSST